MNSSAGHETPRHDADEAPARPGGALRVVVTTREALRHRLFLRLMQQSLGEHVVGVLIQRPVAAPPPRLTSLLQRAPRAGARRARAAVRHVVHTGPTWLPDDPARADATISRLLAPLEPVELAELGELVHVAPDPNAPEAQAWLRALEPDLVVVFGGVILRGAWLEAPRVAAINMHYGVLPHYRSSYSTTFALYHERPDRIGATVHLVDAGVDTGPLLRIAPAIPEPGDTLEDVRGLVYAAGIRAVVEVAAEYVRGEPPVAQPTASTATSLYLGRHLTDVVQAAARGRLAAGSAPWPRLEPLIESSPPPPRLRGRLSARVERLPGGVYILNYHSIVPPRPQESWERAYDKVLTDLPRFAEHLTWLRHRMQPADLADCWEILRLGPVKQPYLCVTFDDGYRNIADHVPELCDRHGIRPTVFACGDFAAGRSVNYRVLLFELIADGHADAVARILNREFGTPRFTAANLMSETKDSYDYRLIERAMAHAWLELRGGDLPRAHLDFAGLRELVAAGWTVGNHTVSHATLGSLTADEVAAELEGNQAELVAEGLAPLPWIAYPNGRTRHVGPAVLEWLDRHPETFGMFAGGGVNIITSRTEWLRIPIGNCTVAELRRDIHRNAAGTQAALRTFLR